MLVGLSIRNIVLIEQLSLSLGPGLSALTGETGAGKSILLDALGLALGGRGDSSLVRHGADSASVTAEFDLAPSHPAIALLREQELEAESPLVLRRSVSADGRSRAFANDQPVSVGLLRQIGETLVEVHGQFDTHGLLNPQTHRDVLDEFAQSAGALNQVSGLWSEWRGAEQARAEAESDLARIRAEEDYLRHALEELDQLGPEAGEEDRLAERRSMLMHREKLAEAINAALADLSLGDRSAERLLGAAQRHLQRVADKAGGRLDPILETLDRALTEAVDAVADIQSLSADMELDVDDLETLEERLFAMRAVARKHNVEVDALPDLRADFRRRLDLIDDQGGAMGALATAARQAKERYRAAAAALSDARKAAAARLDKAVGGELAPLKLEKARFATLVEPLEESDWGPAGTDRIAFQVSTNPGAPPGPLNRIASGGELARFMLALKVVLARSGSVATLVFDEVDTGIGGAVADAVGERLGRLSEHHQVLVVTHSPQVAARAEAHLRVAKAAAGDHVATTVSTLDATERREEIARMLSGATITNQARAAADSLMAGRA
ncbi:DNA repair protein RecN [Inquilinus sp. CAU 1745]|uniref:DNA repair protein RecN n=1 Tax=Inquilinus sp. CAU 1745 TaxID=3140369 RepID=UPI00325B7889